MIDPEIFINYFMSKEIDTFYGVPDSLLKPVCNYLNNLPSHKHQISTNEAMSISCAIGNHLANGKISCVYMQNSGLGNAINPLVSLASKEVYSIPMILLIGWRGEILNDNNQIKDEPQHTMQGRITCNQLELLNIPYIILANNSQYWEDDIEKIHSLALKERKPVAILCRKNTFKPYKLIKSNIYLERNEPLTRREDIIRKIVIARVNIPIFSTTGMTSRELYEIRKEVKDPTADFYTIGGMGCASTIALGFKRGSGCKQVICIDGDGAALMHLGSLFKISEEKGFIHIIINNNAHDSVGGQPTDANRIDFISLGKSLGYDLIYSIKTMDEFEKALTTSILQKNCSCLIELKVSIGSRENLGRPKETPIMLKEMFINKWSNK